MKRLKYIKTYEDLGFDVDTSDGKLGRSVSILVTEDGRYFFDNNSNVGYIVNNKIPRSTLDEYNSKLMRPIKDIDLEFISGDHDIVSDDTLEEYKIDLKEWKYKFFIPNKYGVPESTYDYPNGGEYPIEKLTLKKYFVGAYEL